MEWIKKLLYICTMEYYSAIKRNAFESVLMRWVKLEPIIQPAILTTCASFPFTVASSSYPTPLAFKEQVALVI